MTGVKIIAIDNDGDEHDMGVFNHGIVMNDDDQAINDVASGDLIAYHCDYGWVFNGGLTFTQFFIQAVPS